MEIKELLKYGKRIYLFYEPDAMINGQNQYVMKFCYALVELKTILDLWYHSFYL